MPPCLDFEESTILRIVEKRLGESCRNRKWRRAFQARARLYQTKRYWDNVDLDRLLRSVADEKLNAGDLPVELPFGRLGIQRILIVMAEAKILLGVLP